MTTEKIPSNVKRAAKKFHKQRALYYKYLASMLTASKGDTKILTLLQRTAQRYSDEPKGILANYWSIQYENNGGDLAETWQGTLPDDEVTIIRVSKNAGDGALTAALSDVARISKLSDKVRKESIGTVIAGVIGLVIAALMGLIFPIFATDKLQELFSFVPPADWGPKGRSMFAHATRVKEDWLFYLVPLVVAGYYVLWSIDNLTGPARNWLDNNIAIYRTIRDIKGTLFLSTMSTLTRRRGNVMFTLGESLQTLAQSSKSPWFRWRIEEVISGIEVDGATGSDAFDTGLLSREMYYFLRDTQEARGFAEGFDEVGRYVEETILEEIIKSMVVYRWTMLMAAVLVVVFVVGWNMAVLQEMSKLITSITAR